MTHPTEHKCTLHTTKLHLCLTHARGQPQIVLQGSSAAGWYHAQGPSVMEEEGGEHWLITPPANLVGFSQESNWEPLGYNPDTITTYP